MDSSIAELLQVMTDNYLVQSGVYEELYHIALSEKELIDARDIMQLIDLLHLADEKMNYIRQLDEQQKQYRQILSNALPSQQVSMEQLACRTEARVFVRFKEAMDRVTDLLLQIESQKNENILKLAQIAPSAPSP